MVLSTLSDIKTNTRRIVLPQPEKCPGTDGFIEVSKWISEGKQKAKKGLTKIHTSGAGSGLMFPECPFGKKGDILYVRENWQPRGFDEEGCEVHVKFIADDKIIVFEPEFEVIEKMVYLIDKEVLKKNIPIDRDGNFIGNEFPLQVRPSIHLPKMLSRIWLQVTDIRAELLQDISEEDAIAEGVESYTDHRLKSRPTHYKVYHPNSDPDALYSSRAYDSFQTLWESINGIDSWNENPWVWAISFKVLSKTGYQDVPEEIRQQLEGKEVAA